ncbi:MAG: ATP-binding cassette domain-containing protein, partial [Phycisphaerae bacterium]|nr:ATP-binding cassette domain-containing protein [Phycisphaerae bacterium]
MIVYQNITKSFDNGVTRAVNDVSFNVRQGETLVLLGSSGCGKTTLLKLTNRLLDPTSGTVIVDGCDVASQDPIALRRKIGYVFQGIGLFPHMTVEENVAMVLRLQGQSRRERRRRAHELLETVGLKPDAYGRRFPSELSGGQQQRVFIARAVAQGADLLLLDEPFSGLDIPSHDAILEILESLHDEGVTVMVATHDLNLASERFDQVMLLNRQIIAFGPGSSILTTENLVSAYGGHMHVLG